MSEDYVDRRIAARLRSRRRLLGMTLQEVADAADMRFQQVQKYETAHVRVSAANLWRLASALRVDISFFFDGLAAAPAALPKPANEASERRTWA